ncbi:hypothetical protein FRX31_004156 [Thalictrum thalictroides]|uniref:Uncharacterized protein n=1 Tax=Thalictrum thalictroides TaxID=46969 RepID=A0A7J6XBG3_THATH|nr:hypothetical protein FRX31_004156 [Thalictrum thalictroides]
MEIVTKKREFEESISGTTKGVSGDGDEEKKKIYLNLGQSDSVVKTGWVVVDPLFTSIEEAEELMKFMPTKLQQHRCYANVVWKSKIFFIGGQFWDENVDHFDFPLDNFSNQVIAFDVATQTWEDDSTYPNLQSGRMSARAVVGGNRIFVFGTLMPDLLQNEHFGEYLDLSSSSKEEREWRYIPNPPNALCQVAYIQSIAVCNSNEKHHFLFWAYPYGCLFILDYHSLEWQTVETFFGYPQKDPAYLNENDIVIPHLEPFWSNQVVFLDDAVFWHYGSKIYAHDFKKKTPNAIDVCTFEDPSSTFVQAVLYNFPRDDSFPPTYLISQGKGRLSLIWDVFEGSFLYYCKNFRVERTTDNQTLVVHEIKGYAKLRPPLSNFTEIYKVLLM